MKLLVTGHQVVAVNNLSRGFKQAVPPGCRFIKADIGGLSDVLSKADGIEAVVHLAALLVLERMKPGKHSIYNLGNGDGFSNKQIIAAVEKVTGKSLKVRVEPPRAGDPPRLIGSNQKIKKELAWTPARPELNDMIESAWKFYQSLNTDRIEA